MTSVLRAAGHTPVEIATALGVTVPKAEYLLRELERLGVAERNGDRWKAKGAKRGNGNGKPEPPDAKKTALGDAL